MATSPSAHDAAPILVASENVDNAKLVKRLLEPEFGQVFLSTFAENAVKDFDQHSPRVLILAFGALEKSEQHYLRLYRQSQRVHLTPHRTVILCSKDEVKNAYELCRKELFDDYILFWPMTHDTPRLLMSVHLALRELDAQIHSGPAVAEFAAGARRLTELEALLDRHLSQGGERLESAGRAVAQAEQNVGAVLDGFSQRLIRGELAEVADIKSIDALEREIARIKQVELRARFQSVGDSMKPLQQWADHFKQEVQPHIESARSLSAMADQVKPTILVVDDDDLHRKIVGKMLEAGPYRLTFAANGAEAMHALRKLRPELILTDVLMPELDGIELTRRIKAMPHLAKVPVIMITGKSEGQVVMDSLKAGAADFVVKPLDRAALVAKVSRALRGLAQAGE